MSAIQTKPRRLFNILGLIVAGMLGFALAKMTTRPTPFSVASRPDAAETSGSAAKLAVDESDLAAIGIELGTVTAGSLSAEIRAPAVVSSAPDAQAIVTAHAAGTLVSIDKQLGDTVRAGEILARVESREAAAIAADRDVAISRASLARSVMQREKGLFDQHVTPRQDLEAAEAQLVAAQSEERRARAAAANAHVAGDGRSIQIVSPLSGHITAADARLGSFVQADTELFRIADPSQIQIEASVTAADAAHIAAGDSAVVTLRSRNSIDAVVRSVTAAIDEQTRSATVVLSLVDPQKKPSASDGPDAGKSPLRGLPAPGEFVQVVITPRAASPAGFVVPEEAVQRIDGRDVVFARTRTGFRVQPVIVGSRSGGRSLVLSGLTAGEKIATRNAFFLKAELGKGAEEDEE
jgi:cobalt-zinc-cadmium efflux system membrane fusion protein